MQKLTVRALVFILAGISCLSPANGQETRSTIFGRITDPQNAAVVSATVVVTNADTNVTTTRKTNESGYYEAELLLPGNYSISADAPGFKKSLQSGIVLPLSTRIDVSISLQLGAATDTVRVTAEAPLVDPSSSVSAGRVMDSRDVVDLPIFNNSPLMMIKVAPGVQSSNNRRYNGVNALGGTADAHSLGGFPNDWSIDGVPDMGNGSEGVAYMPYSTTIQEYETETENFDASVGHTAGMSIKTMTRAGTNAYHGDLTDQYWNQRWNGTPFFVKQAYYTAIDAANAVGNTGAREPIAEPAFQSRRPRSRLRRIRWRTGENSQAVQRQEQAILSFLSFDGFDDRENYGNRQSLHSPHNAGASGKFLRSVGGRVAVSIV